MISNFSWDWPTIVVGGVGSRSLVPKYFSDLGAKRMAIITDKGLVAAGVVDMVINSWEKQDQVKLIGIYDQAAYDADSTSVNECARWCRLNAIDSILTIGGGSVMDVAKGVKMMLGMGAIDVLDLMPNNMGIYMKPEAKHLGIPHISIPTTAGTGSEVSCAAVILNKKLNQKGAIVHYNISADYAILDPEVTVSLPPRLTAETGFDALSHAMEGYFNSAPFAMTDALSLHAVRLIKKYLPIAVADGKNLEARINLLQASTLAIQAFIWAGANIPAHNISHAVGAKYHVPHGAGCCIALPIVMEAYPEWCIGRIAGMAQAWDINTENKSPEELLALTIASVRKLQADTGAPTVFDVALDTKEKRQEIINLIKTDPVAYQEIPTSVIEKIIDKAFKK
ncbi:iron-containing alcohol dehydrogenase [Desulfallas sp. Bu1-1]|uniref:iron-containing alcohol dehydrogenase n=1 Tax=Desulfallas sp. Bu1-1 TaxID=2787620 RepID=UPI0018A01766|nr:iron-containing alcohol dehydrogenase [Desulfallas sp. Bu1-1]MBF7084304.1 iron-containing alcohol dehydrogenase [Desulfallas sp. Bu1-1]